MKTKYYFGIDLGTTNSAIGVVSSSSNGEPQIVELDAGAHTLPSCVMYSNGTIIVGSEAYNQRYLTKQVVYSVKRWMGTDKLFHIDDGKCKFTVTPVEVSAEILKSLKYQAEKRYGKGSVQEITVTVPAYFNVAQRRDTQAAVELAGMKLLKIINEPTAASLAYDMNKSTKSEKIMVYDLGGGTFDVTLIEVSSKSQQGFDLFNLDTSTTDSEASLRVIANGGDARLGGDDVDLLVYTEALKLGIKNSEFSNDVVESITLETKEKAILAIERYKKSGIREQTFRRGHVLLNVLDSHSPEFQFVWDGDLVDSCFEKIYNKTKFCVRECLSSTRNNKFSKIVLNGGSTKYPLLKTLLARDFPGAAIYDSLNPDESVALGAAVQTAIIQGENIMTVSDVVPLPIGIEAINDISGVEIPDRFLQIIKKDALLPTSNSQNVSTVVDNQTGMRIKVYQGVSRVASENTLIGEVLITGIEPDIAGRQCVDVAMAVDVNGLLSVEVRHGDNKVEGKFDTLVENSELNKGADLHPALQRKLLRYRKMIDSSTLNDEEKDRLNDLVNTYQLIGKEPKVLADKILEIQKEKTQSMNAGLSHVFTHDSELNDINSSVVDQED